MEETPQAAVPASATSVRHTLERKPGSVAVLSVEVDAERLTRATDRVFQRRVRQAKIPGFRPGRAPRAIYERAYGAGHLWAEAAEDVVDESYREVVRAEGLDPLDRPEVVLSRIEPGQPLAYTATVPVRPAVTLGDYRAARPEIAVKPVSDDEVRAAIERMREQHAVLQPVERGAREGDVMTIDVDLAVDGGAPAPFGRNAHLELGRPFSIAGFAEGLLGAQAGEERAMTLSLPGNYRDEKLRGKPGTFTVRVTAVAEPVLPAFDEEFAKSAGVADLAALDRAVRGELAHAAFHEARDTAADQLLDRLLAVSTLELPEVLATAELDHLMAELRARVKERGLAWEQFLLEARKTEEELRAEWREAAERRARSLLVLDAVAEQEGVGVSSEELAREAALTPIAQQDPNALRDPRVLASLARSLRNRKVVDRLLGLEGPDAEREYLRRAGAPEEAQHDRPPEIVVPAPKPQATAEGRAAIRELLDQPS